MSKSVWSGLEKLQRKVKKLETAQNIPFDELFNPSFMNRYTEHSTIDEFFNAGGFKFYSEEEFENLPEDKLNQHVQNTTNFKSGCVMLTKAGEYWVAKELGF